MTVSRTTAAALAAVSLALAVAGCGANAGNGDSVTTNGVTPGPASPTESSSAR